MPVPIDYRTSFIEGFLVDEFNRPLKVRPWMKEHVIEPLDGYQSWRRGEVLCDKCKALVARIHATLQACKVEPHGACNGVDGVKIVLTILNLKRQQGKTTTGAAYSISELFLARNSNILYLAASEKQSGRIFDAKWVQPIVRNPRLSKKVTINGTEIEHPKRGNRILYVSTSVKSVPGGSWRLLIIDEGALVAPKVVSKLVPSIIAAHGLECPWGHYTGGADEGSRKDCPACGVPLEEWHGRVLIMSSSDEDSGWYYELVEMIGAEPKASTHMYRSADTINPHTSEATIQALDETFGQLPSMEGLMGRELRNEFTREGDEFVPKKAIDAVKTPNVLVETSEMPCVAFLDCSRTGDLTSLVLAGDPAPQPAVEPFKKIAAIRVDVWDPRDFPSLRVDYKAIRAHLERIMTPGVYPGLLRLAIDVTLVQDAAELYDWTQQQTWRGKVEAFRTDRLSNQLMWQHLSQRLLTGRAAIEIPDHKRLIEELRAARVRVTPEGVEKVMDSAAGDRRVGRLHRDVAMSLAGCCLLAARYMARAADKSVSVAHQINTSLKLQGQYKPISSGVATKRF